MISPIRALEWTATAPNRSLSDASLKVKVAVQKESLRSYKKALFLLRNVNPSLSSNCGLIAPASRICSSHSVAHRERMLLDVHHTLASRTKLLPHASSRTTHTMHCRPTGRATEQAKDTRGVDQRQLQLLEARLPKLPACLVGPLHADGTPHIEIHRHVALPPITHAPQ